MLLSTFRSSAHCELNSHKQEYVVKCELEYVNMNVYCVVI